VKLPCLVDCSVTTWRLRDPVKYQHWHTYSHMREFRNKPDPSDRMFNDPQHMTYYECEKDAMQLCRFLRPDYFRQCYEKVKFNCLKRVNNWNTLLDD